MDSYLNGIEDKSFAELKDNIDFKYDLVDFFKGDRYAMTEDEMVEEGYEGLTKKFIEHMRFQEWNDATAVKDLNFINNKKADPQSKVAFGRLIQAWDNSAKAGTGFLDGAADVGEALIKSPSTYLGFGSLGLAKVGAKGATKVAQLAVRSRIKEYFKKKAVLKGAATGAAVEGSIGSVQSYGMGESREALAEQGNFIEGYEYSKGDLAQDVVLNSTVGAVFGGLGGKLNSKIVKDKEKLFGEREKAIAAAKEKAKETASETIKKAEDETPDVVKEALERTVTMVNTLSARRGGKNVLDPLDPQEVAMGEAIKKGIIDTGVDEGGAFSSGLDITTIRSIAAATIEISKKFNVNPKERITSAIATAIRDPDSDAFSFLNDTREKFNLTKEQMSFIYLADVSNAGKILAEQSAIVRKGNKAATSGRSTAKKDLRNQLTDLKVLAEGGLSSIDDIEATDISANVVKNTAVRGGVEITYNFLQDLDQMRIAFMTSQPATTARNVASTGLLAVVDVMDESFRSIFRAGKGERANFKNIFSVLKGMTYGKSEASLMRDMLQTEMPEVYQRTFHDTLRMEVATKSNSRFAKVGRIVNMANTATDTVFKETAFYGSIDRQLRLLNDKTLGTSVRDFINKGGKLDSLKEKVAKGLENKDKKIPGDEQGTSILDKAVDDANRFTMQRTYVGDQSLFGKGARVASKLNERMPFVISGFMGIPFPRYIANHMEMIMDYTPFIPEMLNVLEDQAAAKGKKVTYITGDPYKSLEDRRVRQLTGASLILAGSYIASQKEGEIDYKSLENQIKGEDDISSSLGFLIAPIFIGDTIYRANNGLPYRETVLRDTASVLGGIEDMGFDATGLKTLADTIMSDKKKAESRAEKMFGNIFSVFTYPATPIRDLMGQFNYDSSGSPYTRPLGMGIKDDPSTPDVDESVSDSQRPEGIFVGQATRFLPDVAFRQYSQSREGNPNYDYEYYSILNKQPIATMNPLKKTFTGVAANPTLTELGREFNKLKIEERDVYNNNKNVNPVVDYVVRRDLSQNLSLIFNKWAETNVFDDGEEAGKTYNQLTDSGQKKDRLLKFVNQRIKETSEKYNNALTNLMSTNPIKARGYIRNQYMLKVNEIGIAKMDFATKYMYDAGMIDKKYSSAQELLSSAENLNQEMQIRLKLIFVANSNRVDSKAEKLVD